MMEIRPFAPDELSVIGLWQACGLIVPSNDPHKDIFRKVQDSPELFLVGEVDGVLVGSCMAGYDGHRGWINYLAVHPNYQRSGYARALMAAAEGLLRDRGCPKINLQVRASNTEVVQFYARQGFSKDEVIIPGGFTNFHDGSSIVDRRVTPRHGGTTGKSRRRRSTALRDGIGLAVRVMEICGGGRYSMGKR